MAEEKTIASGEVAGTPTKKDCKAKDKTISEKVTPDVIVEKLKNTPVVPEKKLNIFEKLLMISSELPTVAKNLEVGVGQSSYKAVGEADVLRAIRPLEAKYGVYSYPFSRTIIESGTTESEKWDKNAKAMVTKKEMFERIEVVYRFVNVNNPSEYIDITTYGDGIDSGDKSVGKAMTYADKYALLKAYKIVTGEDPDQDASGELKDTKVKKEALDPALVAIITETYHGSLESVATYFRKNVDDLTNADLKQLIERKAKAVKNNG